MQHCFIFLYITLYIILYIYTYIHVYIYIYIHRHQFDTLQPTWRPVSTLPCGACVFSTELRYDELGVLPNATTEEIRLKCSNSETNRVRIGSEWDRVKHLQGIWKSLKPWRPGQSWSHIPMVQTHVVDVFWMVFPVLQGLGVGNLASTQLRFWHFRKIWPTSWNKAGFGVKIWLRWMAPDRATGEGGSYQDRSNLGFPCQIRPTFVDRQNHPKWSKYMTQLSDTFTCYNHGEIHVLRDVRIAWHRAYLLNVSMWRFPETGVTPKSFI